MSVQLEDIFLYFYGKTSVKNRFLWAWQKMFHNWISPSKKLKCGVILYTHFLFGLIHFNLVACTSPPPKWQNILFPVLSPPDIFSLYKMSIVNILRLHATLFPSSFIFSLFSYSVFNNGMKKRNQIIIFFLFLTNFPHFSRILCYALFSMNNFHFLSPLLSPGIIIIIDIFLGLSFSCSSYGMPTGGTAPENIIRKGSMIPTYKIVRQV